MPKPTPKPLAMGRARVGVEEIEDEICAASTELVYQRDDLKEAISDDDEHALVKAERALDNNDLVLAREMIRVARFAIKVEDMAARRADRRRERAHGRQKNAVTRAEIMITGRELALPYRADGGGM